MRGLTAGTTQPVLTVLCLSVLAWLVPSQLANMTAKIFSGLLVDSETDWSLRVEEGVLVVLGDRIVERAGRQDLERLAERLYFD